MELVNYLRIVRRRWRMVVVFVLLGTLLGAGTLLLNSGPKGPGVTYFLAKHTLTGGTGTTNLTRDAVFCSEGDVPKRVAEKLGYDNASALATRVICEPHADTNLLYVAAVDADGPRAVEIADAFAEQLVIYLREDGDRQKQDRLETFNRQITGLQSEYWQVQSDLGTATGTTADQLKERQADIAKKINGLKDQRAAVDAQPITTDTLSTLNTAESVAISQAAYESLVNPDPARAKSGSAITPAARTGNVDAAIRAGTGLNLLSRIALGAAFGLLLGASLAVVLDRIDPRIRTKLEAEEAFGWPVIGEIPPLTRRERQKLTLVAHEEPRSRSTEAYRVLRSALLWVDAADVRAEGEHPIFAPASASTSGSTTSTGTVTSSAAATGADRGPGKAGDAAGSTDGSSAATATEARPRGRVIMVTSPGPAEGKTTTAANLAAILAETGRSVLVVNCDFRRPRIHAFLGGTEETRTVSDTKIDNVKLVTHVLDNPNLANPADVVRVQRDVIRNARSMFDIVLLDTAPLLTTNDATEVLEVADQVVIVAKAGKTHKEAADRAAELLERRQGPVVGIVLVGATDIPTARYYYYGDAREHQDPDPGREEETPFAALAPTPSGSSRGSSPAAATDPLGDPLGDPLAAPADPSSPDTESIPLPSPVASDDASPLVPSTSMTSDDAAPRSSTSIAADDSSPLVPSTSAASTSAASDDSSPLTSSSFATAPVGSSTLAPSSIDRIGSDELAAAPEGGPLATTTETGLPVWTGTPTASTDTTPTAEGPTVRTSGETTTVANGGPTGGTTGGSTSGSFGESTSEGGLPVWSGGLGAGTSEPTPSTEGTNEGDDAGPGLHAGDAGTAPDRPLRGR